MNKKKKKGVGKYIKAGIIVGALAFLIGSGVNLYSTAKHQKKMELISYQEYQELLEAGDIDTVHYSPNDKYMYISLHNDKTRKMTVEERENYISPDEECKRVYYPAGEDFRKGLLEKGVLVTEDADGFAKTMSNYGSLLFQLALILIMLKMFTSMSPLKGNTVSEAVPDDIKVTFDDVIGHDEVKKDLKQLIKQMKSSNADFRNLTHGILFEGSAGTGKTMLAKAVAKEAGFNFISVNSSSLIQLYVGLGAKRVREAFEKARQCAPCILFFDEIDAIGTKRGNTRGTAENDQTINALLAEMDGFGDRGDIFVIAATNRAADLDPALVRAGRFDRTVKIEPPTKWETRQELFEHYLKDSKHEKNVDTESLAKQTVGFSGADIAAVCREASMIMYGRDGEKISQEDLEEAIDKIVFKGNRTSEEHSEALEIVAYHEAGHAVMNLLSGKPVARISIMGMTSGVGGAVFQADDSSVFHTKESVEQEVKILYAGRASEEIKFGREHITDGASNDITEATKLLMNYLTRFGFGEGLVDYSVLTSANMGDNSVPEKLGKLSEQFYRDTVEKLNENYDKVEQLAKKLLEVKTLSGSEVQALWDDNAWCGDESD